MRSALLIVPAAAILGASGCGILNGLVCTTEFVYGLNVRVTDVETDEVISGATVTITEGEHVEELQELELDPGIYRGAGERAGTYQVTVTAEGYAPRTIENVVVEEDECHVIPENGAVEMTPE
jgi:hypothetical protein